MEDPTLTARQALEIMLEKLERGESLDHSDMKTLIHECLILKQEIGFLRKELERTKPRFLG
jgi:hypothetical protein